MNPKDVLEQTLLSLYTQLPAASDLSKRITMVEALVKSLDVLVKGLTIDEKRDFAVIINDFLKESYMEWMRIG